MTPAQTRANGLVIPSPLDHWIDAMLRVLVELVQNVASTLRMNRRRQTRDWHTEPTPPAVLPKETTDTQSGTQPAAASSRPVQTRPSIVPLIPAKAGIQEQLRHMHGLEAPGRNKPHGMPWIPAFAGMSGERVMMLASPIYSGSGPWSAFPAKAGIQERLRALRGIEAARRNKPHGLPWLPAFAGNADERAWLIERVCPTGS